MKDYKIFTIEEFDKLVKKYWDEMIKSEFPEWDCVEIQHDISKRRTLNLGKAHYKRITKKDADRKLVPNKLSFSYRLLDGRYTVEFVIDVIKHEVGHHLDLLRNVHSSGHGKNFQDIGKEFGFESSGNSNNYVFKKKSEIYDEITNKEYKYYLTCKCGKVYKSRTKKWWIKDMITIGRTSAVCIDCNRKSIDSNWTLCVFPNGVDCNSPEIDYELYAHLVGGEIFKTKI